MHRLDDLALLREREAEVAMRFAVAGVVRDRPARELLGARWIAVVQRIEHADGELVELEWNIERRTLPPLRERRELEIAKWTTRSAHAGGQHRERGRCAARIEQHARRVSARSRARALGEVTSGVQCIDR